MLWDACGWKDDEDEDAIGDERVLVPEFKSQKVFVQDGSDYHATLFVRSDHFCGEYQPQPKDKSHE